MSHEVHARGSWRTYERVLHKWLSINLMSVEDDWVQERGLRCFQAITWADGNQGLSGIESP